MVPLQVCPFSYQWSYRPILYCPLRIQTQPGTWAPGPWVCFSIGCSKTSWFGRVKRARPGPLEWLTARLSCFQLAFWVLNSYLSSCPSLCWTETASWSSPDRHPDPWYFWLSFPSWGLCFFAPYSLLDHSCSLSLLGDLERGLRLG